MKSKSLKTSFWVAGLVAMSSTASLYGQTAEALMEALVKKGILSEQEAEDIKAELARENNQYNKVKAPGRNTSIIELSGDFRGRFDQITAENDDYNTRNRLRYRLRVGATARFYERFEAGLRLTSAQQVGTFGGDPISGNVSFQDGASKKFVFFDTAYGKFTAVTNDTLSGSFTFGKMDNPFVFSNLLIDRDYTPEGFATQWSYFANPEHTLSLIGGGFILDELAQDSDDPYMLAAQVRWDATWLYSAAHRPKLTTSAGVGIFGINNEEALANNNVPNVNVGNTRAGTTAGTLEEPLVADFNPIVADLTLTYTLDKFPLYNGEFPISVVGEYIYNFAADQDATGISAGFTFGKAGRKATWDIGYRFRYLESDAWYEEHPDSDFVAYYSGGNYLTLAGKTGPEPFAGTNLRGHVVQVNYSPYAALLLTGTWYYSEIIDEHPGLVDSKTSRLQIDATLKF